MQNPNNIQPTSAGKLSRQFNKATKNKSVLSRSGRAVKTLSGPDSINLLAGESLSLGEESVSPTARLLSSDIKIGVSTPKSNAITRQGKVALRRGDLTFIDEDLDDSDRFTFLNQLVEVEKEISNNDLQITKNFLNKEASKLGFDIKTDFMEKDIIGIRIEDDCIYFTKNYKKADLIISPDGLILAKNETLKQHLITVLNKNNFHFSNDIDPEIREQILSNIYYLNIIVVGEEKWNRVIRLIEMYRVVKKVSEVKEKQRKVDFGKQLKLPPLIDRDLRDLYPDRKEFDFSLIINIMKSNYYFTNMAEIISIILNHILELKKELKEEELQERLREIKKEFRNLLDLRFEMSQKDQKINDIVYDNTTSFLRFLLKKDRKFTIL